MYKKIFTFLPLMVLSLLLYSNVVFADEMTITYSDYSLVSSQCFRNVLDDANSRFTYYFIYYLSSTDSYYVYVPRSTYNVTIYRSYANFYLKDTNPYDFYQSTLNCLLPLNSSGYNGAIQMKFYNDWSTSEPFLLYSSLPLNVTGSYQIDTTDGTELITCSVGTTCPSATMYYWYNSTPPSPPDTTPLLSTFVSTTIDSLTYICEFITSSYIYLSIFVVFILTFVVLLVRRFR